MQQGVQRIFLLGLAFVVTLGASLGLLLYVSLIPFFHQIGIVATGVLMLGLGCVAVLMVSFTYNRVCTWNNRRRLLIVGDVVAYLAPDGSFMHLSAMHEQAKLPPPAPPIIVDEDSSASDETVLELWRKGMSLRTIEKATGRSYPDVQKLTSEQKKIEGDPKKRKKEVISD